VVRQINREFLHGAVNTLTPGVYRKGQNLVGNYTPPDQGDLPELMRSFVRWLQKGKQHPVIAAGLAHLHLVAIHPFWDGNGRTARGLEALILQRSEFHFKRLLSMETRFLGVRPHYFAALERSLGKRFGEYDATPWLEFYLLMLAHEVRHLVSQLTEWHRQADRLHVMAKQLGLQNRQADAFFFLVKAGKMTRSDYMEITGVSPVTASRDLKELVDTGLIIAEGRTSSRAYRPAELTEEGELKPQLAAEQMELFNKKEVSRT
jgi:Fic family protein